MSFGFGNNILGDNFVVKNYGDRISNIEKLISYDKVQINHFTKLIEQLSQESYLNIVIRPHPEESLDFYKEKFQSHNNIKVLHEGPVIPWILASNYMVHHSCTTAVEACMLDKIPISYGKNYNHDLVPWIPLEISKKFDEPIDLINYVKKNNFLSNDKYKSILNEYFTFNNDATSEIIREVLANFPPKKPSFFQFYKAYFWFQSNLKLVGKDFLKKVNMYKSRPLFESKFSNFSPASINRIIKILKDEKMIDRKIDIRFFNNEMLKISI